MDLGIIIRKIICIQILVDDSTVPDLKEEIRSRIEEYVKEWFSDDILIAVDLFYLLLVIRKPFCLE